MREGNARLAIKLHGLDKNDGRVRLRDFRNFCDNLTTCLNRIADKIVGAQAEHDIAALDTGSAVIELIPNLQTVTAGAAVIVGFDDTVAAIQNDSAIDPRLDDDDLTAFRKLGGQLGRTLSKIEIGRSSITTEYVANIDKRLLKAICTLGTIKGVLERINVHEATEFYIYPPLADSGVECRFPEELVETVRKALKRNVTVSGKLYYLPDAAFPRVVHAESIEIHPADADLPTLLDLKGVAPDCTGGIPVLEYLRSRPE